MDFGGKKEKKPKVHFDKKGWYICRYFKIFGA